MQAKYIQEGESIDYTPVAAVASGQVVVQNGRIGIATRAIAAGVLGALALCGLFSVVKVNGAITDATPLYWDEDGNPQGGTAGTGALTTSSTGNIFFGWAQGDAAETAETVRATLDGPALTVHSTYSAIIADPGNAGAIPVTRSGSVQIVTAGAETRTLAVPTFVGQTLAISMKTDGGDGVITVAAAINAAGNNTITLNDAGDTIVLLAIENGANKRWKVIANDGATLSTV